LLTGTTVFTAETLTGLLMHHIQSPPTPPSQRSELPVPVGFEAVIMACLAKDPADRPGTARQLDARLAELENADAWTRERCREWWERHLPAPVPAPA
jgi:serine/threonine-protein kinase